ncbi:unnamed protein product [Tuber melanosporum]|uniref:(Perigord truffle) hypothetical protein n=1 Tax=Tuber melanosporum (strain Mel28) TaxID=656061 RepID=D5GL65_TUBMM|nr:uncharacterized protein GSTUM_00010026001 [Tuber melanosporum]CAZ85258.1 unnamed protein product [Tuber melanosporum]
MQVGGVSHGDPRAANPLPCKRTPKPHRMISPPAAFPSALSNPQMAMATMRITTSTLLPLLQIPYSLAISLLQFLTSLPPLLCVIHHIPSTAQLCTCANQRPGASLSPSKPNHVITSPKKAYPERNSRLLIADLP